MEKNLCPVSQDKLNFSVFPLETRAFEKKQIFQEEQKTIFAIIKPVLGIFF